MKEIWKSIPGYEGLYQVSNLGRVKSLLRNTTRGKVLSLQNRQNGYFCVCLCKNGVSKRENVHRIVAEAFLPHSDSNNVVNHKDENKHNNKVTNLEWTTQKYNLEYRDGIYKRAKSRSGFKNVLQIQNGRVVGIYHTLHEAARAVNGWPQNIWHCVHSKALTAYGYEWRYANAKS